MLSSFSLMIVSRHLGRGGSRTARYDCVFTHFSEGDVLRLRDLAVKEVPRELGVDAVKL